MTLFICQKCNHRHYEMFGYTPLFCRSCGSSELKAHSFALPLVVGMVAAVAVYVLTI